MKCIICKNEKPESEEHIIPEALQKLITDRDIKLRSELIELKKWL